MSASPSLSTFTFDFPLELFTRSFLLGSITVISCN